MVLDKSLNNLPKHTAEELKNYYESIINMLPEHVYWKDQEGRYLGCNFSQAQTVGFSALEEILGKTDFELPWKDHAPAIRKIDEEVMATGKPYSIVETVVLPNGKSATFLSKKAPLYQKGKIAGILGISFDITKEKEAELAIQEAQNRAAQEANKAKTEFLENMRHDIRTPLTGIVGFANILKEEANEPKIKEYADNLIASSHALLKFLNEVLETIRLTSGDIPLLKKKFNLQQKLTDIIHLSQSKAKEKKLDLVLEIDPALSPYFIGDYKRIQRIVLELISNALTFTNKGSVKISATLEKQESHRVITKITVEDTGIGIPLDKQEEVFVRFKRLSPSYEGIYKGVGLGLSVVKQFIDDLHAEIYLSSEVNAGSIFTCLIPLQVSLTNDAFGSDVTPTTFAQLDVTQHRSDAVQVLASSVATSDIQSQLSQVLIVEDNLLAQKMAKYVVENLSCHATIAADGNTALQLASEKKFDLIFMDIGLPDIDGYEVAKRIRLNEWNKETHVPIIALTAHVGAENKQRCIEIGMDAVLSKPLNVATISDILNAFIPSRAKAVEKSVEPVSSNTVKDSLFALRGEVIDHKIGLETAGGDETVFEELLDMMCRDISEEKLLMAVAHEKNDWKKIRASAHKLNGGACFCGATRLREACTNLENYFETGKTELVDALYQQVLNEMEAFRQGRVKI